MSRPLMQTSQLNQSSGRRAMDVDILYVHMFRSASTFSFTHVLYTYLTQATFSLQTYVLIANAL